MKTQIFTAAPTGVSLLLSLALILSAAPIQAQEEARTLAYHPAELNFADGRRSVLKRIRDVARLNCPRYGRVRELAEIARCQRAAEADLVEQIGDPGFTAFAAGSKTAREQVAPVVASH